MAHLAAGPHFQLAIEVQAQVRLGKNIAPFLGVLADQVVHLDAPAPRRRAERPAGNGADMLFELRGLRAVQRPVAGIVDARRKLVDDQALVAVHIAGDKQLDGEQPDVIERLDDLPGDRLGLDPGRRRDAGRHMRARENVMLVLVLADIERRERPLDAARREVKRWKLEQLTHMKANAELDPVTSWFVLAWDAFRATVFDYDEALRLARAVGVDLDKDIIGWLAEKKGSDVRLWDSAARAAKGGLGPADGSRAMVDAIHHAAHLARTRNLDAARELLAHNHVDRDAKFFSSLEAVLEVLPVSKAFSGIELESDAAAQGSDFEVLENLRRLAFSDRVDEPKQLDLWKEVLSAN